MVSRDTNRLTKENLREAINIISPKRKTFWNTWIGDIFPEKFQKKPRGQKGLRNVDQ